MKIGELAKRTDTPVETIRYYEREELLPPAARTEGNYRLYAEAHVGQLVFIRHCRNLDMTLGEIRALLRLKADPAADCGDVNRLFDAHIDHVARRIRELQALKRNLQALRRRCIAEGERARCGILDGLSQAPAEGTPAAGSHIPGSHTLAERKPI